MQQLKGLARRFAERTGGYTRIHLHGNRKGDHAPRAILELVDGPRDLRLEMTARAIARETLRTGFGSNPQLKDYANGRPYTEADFVGEMQSRFATLTAKNIHKVTRYGNVEARERLASQTNAAVLWQRAQQASEGERRIDTEAMQAWAENGPRGATQPGALVMRPYKGKKYLAGEEGGRGSELPRLARGKHERKHSVIRLGKGQFAKQAKRRLPNGRWSTTPIYQSSLLQRPQQPSAQ